MDSSKLQFAPWTSDIELSFYSALASRKINHDKLDDAARKILGRYEIRPGDPPERSTRMQIHGNAFTADDLPLEHFRAEGILRNVNTIEEYKTLDRAAIIERAGRTIWDAIVDGTIYSCPSLLSSFYVIFFADLKKYKHTYHFAFPALHSKMLWRIAKDPWKFSPLESSFLSDAVMSWKYAVDPRQHGFFLAKRFRVSSQENSQGPTDDDPSGKRPETPKTPKASDLDFQWLVASLSSFDSGFFDNVFPQDRFICFADPSTYSANPGWPLRNLLILIRHRWHLTEAQVLCYRDKHIRRDQPASIVLQLVSDSTGEPAAGSVQEEMPKVTGWERNDRGALNSRSVDLSAYMDPYRLADQSVDLNLALMKWRIAPRLDLDLVKNTSCLLLGAGTLGSYVSRNLLGWGVRKITLVDNGRVSFSNPVRQPLFNFADCTEGGRWKAERAAEALIEIYPGVQARGISMNVPMAGHPIMDESKTRNEFEQLQKLIEEHDVIFLLMDTRESRWLPTVMGKAAGKIVVNAALGFDTYVVMRHGSRLPEPDSSSAVPSSVDKPEAEPPRPTELGCYFCNDVFAPLDSASNRTLDQQCTVTRPGIASMASALLVELLVSTLQHPLRSLAPSPPNRAAPRSPLDHPLGLVPHSIRGFLSTWDNVLVSGPAYDCCSACSGVVLGLYEKDGWTFVRRALAERGWLEEICGLREVQRKAEAAAAAMELDDDESVGDIDEEGEML